MTSAIPLPKGKLQRFILATLTAKVGKTRTDIEDAYATHVGMPTKSPGTYQALKHLQTLGLVESQIGKPTGSRGRTPHTFTLTAAGIEAKKAVKKDHVG